MTRGRPARARYVRLSLDERDREYERASVVPVVRLTPSQVYGRLGTLVTLTGGTVERHDGEAMVMVDGLGLVPLEDGRIGLAVFTRTPATRLDPEEWNHRITLHWTWAEREEAARTARRMAERAQGDD